MEVFVRETIRFGLDERARDSHCSVWEIYSESMLIAIGRLRRAKVNAN